MPMQCSLVEREGLGCSTCPGNLQPLAAIRFVHDKAAGSKQPLAAIRLVHVKASGNLQPLAAIRLDNDQAPGNLRPLAAIRLDHDLASNDVDACFLLSPSSAYLASAEI